MWKKYFLKLFLQATRGLLCSCVPRLTFSEPDILLTIDLIRTRVAYPFWPGKFTFFCNDHFYSQKVTPIRALRPDSWVEFLS